MHVVTLVHILITVVCILVMVVHVVVVIVVMVMHVRVVVILVLVTSSCTFVGFVVAVKLVSWAVEVVVMMWQHHCVQSA